MADDLARAVIRDWERLDGERGTWKSHCQQVSLYLYPDRADFMIERTPGQKRMQWVYDATPIFALEQFAAGMHARLTSNTLPWFYLQADEERLNNIYRVRAWLDAASAHLYTVFNSPHRNFASQSHELYLDMGAFGTAVMAALESETSGILFSTRHLRECCLAENDEDRVDHLSRRWQWTAPQAARQWGPRAPDAVKKAMADGDLAKKFWFHHRAKPRQDRDPQRADGRNKPFESVYVDEASTSVITEGGFNEFPYVAPRLSKIPQEVTGRGRGMMLLPDIKMLNELMKITVKGAQKVVDPPLMLPDDGFIVPIKTTPGAFNYYRAGTRPTDRIAAIETHGNIPLGIELIQGLRQKILDGFYVSLMVMPTDPQDPASVGKGVTATFTARQKQENEQILSPILSRTNAEFTSPVIDRVFAIEWRRARLMKFGAGSPFPPPPPELSGKRLHAEYVSPIALAQRATELSAVDRVVQRQLELRQIDPQTPMVLDAEAILRLEARDLNAPVQILKSSERLRAEAEQAARIAEQQHQAMIAEQGSGAVANLAQARRQMTQQAA